VKFHRTLLVTIILFLTYPSYAMAQQENHKLPPQKAAEQGDVSAQFQLGLKYLYGDGVSQDYAEAEIWIRKAAEQDDSTAQFFLGSMYFQSNVFPQDYAEAEIWIRKAAEQGNVLAQLQFGTMCLQGNGVSQDYVKAEKWFRKAAEQGNAEAQSMLGAIYAAGLGSQKDSIQAYMWLTHSINGSKRTQAPYLQKATELRNLLAKSMTPQQIEEAQQLTKEWSLNHPKRIGNYPNFRGSDFTEPVILERANPSYTEKARDVRVEGIVVLQFMIRKDGTLNSFKVIRSLGYGLDESAIYTVANRWHFKPATYEGMPVDYQAQIEVRFQIK